jgi:hypothetical protein
MSRQYKPLKLRDTVLSGNAADGIVAMRIKDGDKLVSKRFNIAEVVMLRDWFAAFVRQNRYSNYFPANIDEIERLSIADVDSIRQRFDNGEAIQKLADEFKVPVQMIMGITRT